jgi:uncharacterized UBP type Zn finger protein
MQGFHAVSPKQDCPHCTEENIAPKEKFELMSVTDPCFSCGYKGENWICLKPNCGTVGCSRYVKGHMANEHQVSHSDLSHPIVFSFADFSFWCYACDSYIIHPLLDH